MLNNNYICVLDIGSSKIAACVARVRRGTVTAVFFDTLPSRGVKEGVIVDSIELVDCVGRLLKNLKSASGLNIKSLSTNISGRDIATKYSRAVIPLAERGNKVITLSDIQKVNAQARILGSSLEEEIIHQIPAHYAIDSKSSLINPLGLYSHRLEVNLFLVCGKLSSIQSLTRVINQSGYEIKNLFFSGFATARAVFGEAQKKGLKVFCDMGSDITELLIFKDGILKDVEILNMGGDDFTRQLSKDLKINFDLAQDVKRSYGIIGDAGQISQEKEILLKKNDLYEPVKQKLVSEIITQKAKQLSSGIKEALEGKVSFYEVDNFIATGRAFLIEGFIEMLENVLEVPVSLGRLNNPQLAALVKENRGLSGQKYPVYLTCLGMLSDSLQKAPQEILFTKEAPAHNPITRALNRFKEVYQEYF